MASQIGLMIDNRYEVIGELGRGGMGVVYKATDTKMDRIVAIKVMTGQVASNDEYRERFLREARSVAKLQHPNIVVVHDYGEHAGAPYMAMEYVEGTPLDKLITSGADLSLVIKLDYIIQVCHALGYAHQFGIVHRDVKPANIMVLGGGQRVKLLDFGIARAGGASNLSKSGLAMGTIYYMSPQQTRGQRDLDGRADIFSVGVVLYELFAGRVPWTGESDYEVMDKIINAPYPPLSTYLRRYPTALDGVLERALAKEVTARYQRAEDMAADLAELQTPLKEQLLQEARVAFEDGDLLRANDLVSQILRVDSRHGDALDLRSRLQQFGELQERAEEVRKLRAAAEQALGQKRFQDALIAIDQAITLHSTNPELLRYRELIRQEIRRREDVRKKLELARRAEEINDLSSAQELVEKALELDPTDTQARMMKAVLGQRVEAEQKQRTLKGLADEAQHALTARRITELNAIIREIEVLDPNFADLVALKQAAGEAQEHERRRRQLEMRVREVQRVLNTGTTAQALFATEQALADFPDEPALLRLRVQAEARHEAAERECQARAQAESQRVAQEEAARKAPTPPQPERRPEMRPEQDFSATAVLHSTPASTPRPAPGEAASMSMPGGPAAPPITEAIPAPASKPRVAVAAPKPRVALSAFARGRPAIYLGSGLVLISAISLVLYFATGRVTTVRFEAEPTGAKVSVAGRVCVSPCDLQLRPGNYLASVTHEGYAVAEKRITVGGAPQTISIKLSPAGPSTGRLAIEVNVTEVKVRVDGVLRDVTTGNTITLELFSGTHEIAVEKNGYEPAVQRVEVTSDREARVQFTLTPAAFPPEAPTNADVIVTGTPGATIAVDGQNVATIRPDGSASFTVTPRRHQITVELSGYIRKSVPIKPRAGESVRVVADLQPLPKAAPSVDQFEAASSTIQPGQATELRWRTRNATVITIEPGVGSVPPSGSQQVSPGATVTYSLIARGEGQPAQRSVTVTVAPAAATQPAPTIIAFDSGSDRIQAGQAVKLIWRTQNATSVSIEPEVGAVEVNGSREVRPSNTTRYVLTARGAGGTTSNSVEITVTSAAVPAEDPDAKAIRDTIDRFREAYQLRSVEELQKVWRSIPKKTRDALRETFTNRDIRAITVRYNCAGDPAISGDTAEFDCSETLTYTTDTVQRPQTVAIRFVLRKASGTWFVEDHRPR